MPPAAISWRGSAVTSSSCSRPSARTATSIDKLARRILDAITQPLVIDGNEFAPSTSMGIAIAPQDGGDGETLLRNADLALYRAKEAGRGTYAFFEESLNQRAQQRHQLETDLRLAVERNEFELYYQPLFDLEHNRICSFEALIRWNHPKRGQISPADFIPIAEDTGLIVPIGAWVVREACRQAAGWPEHVRVAVNVSPVQFHRGALNETILLALADSGLAPARLEVEITESIFLEGSESTLRLLHSLRSLGIRIALDDFGTGYSSLSYLQSFPFDKLKIDRSFIQNLLTREGASAIVRAITELAHALNIETTAEGVEETAQLMELRAHGCSSVQGFLFAEPMTAADVDRLFREDGGHSERRLIAALHYRAGRWPWPGQRHCDAHLGLDQLQHMRDPGLAARRERIGPGASQQHEVRAKREHAHHVEARSHAAVGEDRELSGNGLGDARQRPRARQGAVELAPAVVRNDNAVGAARRGLPRVVRIENALDDQRAVPLGPHPFDVAPADRRVEIGVDPAWKSLKGARLPTIGSRLPRLCGRPRMPTSHNQPGRASSSRIRRNPPPQPARIAIARSGNRQIDGQHQCSAALRLGARDELADEAAILDEIELVPGDVARRRDFAERAGADRRQRERNARRGRGLRRLALAAARIKPDSPTGPRPTGIAQRLPNIRSKGRSSKRRAARAGEARSIAGPRRSAEA